MRSAAAVSLPSLPPALRGGLPFLGHAVDFYRRPVDFLGRARRQHGECFRFPLAGKQVNAFIGPRAHEAVFRAPDDQLGARDVYQFMVPIFGKGIVYDSPPALMDEQLGFVFPALKDERLRRYAAFMQEEAESYLERWGDSGEVDMLDTTNEVTMFIASRCLLGLEFRKRLSTEFARLYKDLEGGINLIAFFNPRIPTPAHWRRDRARTRVVELISKIISERRAKNVEGEDFLQTLMSAHYQDGRTLTDDNIAGLLLALIFAGQHTSAVLAAWTGILLLQNRQYLPPIMKEQEGVFPTSEVTLERLRSLDVLHRAIMEAERMHPPLIMLMRAILKDFEYDRFVCPAGELALVSPAVAHHLPDVFKDPQRYDPDRFAPGREEHKQSPYTLIGFGGGKHRCIGMGFAYLQIKALWSVILRRFELTLVDQEYAPNYATFVVGPRQPCRVRYRRLQG